MSRATILNTVAAFAVVALPITADAQTPVYHVTDLGGVPGAAACVPTAINDAGMVVGPCATDGLSNTGVVVWRDGTFVDLGLLPGGHYAWATALNSRGVIVGDGDTGDYQPRPIVTSNGQVIGIAANQTAGTATPIVAQ